MRIGIISDVHSNQTALEAVLTDMPEVEKIVSLGDVIGYGPRPKETAETVRQLSDISIRGNHEHYLENPIECKGNNGAYKGIKHAQSKLNDDLIRWLTSTPMRHKVSNKLKIAHGHPSEQNPYRYIREHNVRSLVSRLKDAEYTILAVGHSHIQFKRDLRKSHDGAGIVVNPGSVGQPRDNDPRAGYAIVDTDPIDVSLHRVEYDVENTIRQVENSPLPEENGKRLRKGRIPRNR